MELLLYRTNLCSWVSSSSIDKSSNVGPPCKSISRPAFEAYVFPRNPQHRSTFRAQRRGGAYSLCSTPEKRGDVHHSCTYTPCQNALRGQKSPWFFVRFLDCSALRKSLPDICCCSQLEHCEGRHQAKCGYKSSEPWRDVEAAGHEFCRRPGKRRQKFCSPLMPARDLLRRHHRRRAGDFKPLATSAQRKNGSAMETVSTVAGEEL